MKLSTSFVLATIVGIGSVTSLTASDRIDGTRILAGGRNAPTIIASAPAKEIRLVRVSNVSRTEILAGGRNAPFQIKQPTNRFQIAPAVRKQK